MRIIAAPRRLLKKARLARRSGGFPVSIVSIENLRKHIYKSEI